MDYKHLERDFITRSLEIIEQYDCLVAPSVEPHKQYEETLFINCLLGLLILPKERWAEQIKGLDPQDITAWGIPSKVVISWGSCQNCGKDSDRTLKQFLRRMRNAASHTRFTPIMEHGQISGWEFKDRNGFHAELPKEVLREFITRLADSLLAG